MADTKPLSDNQYNKFTDWWIKSGYGKKGRIAFDKNPPANDDDIVNDEGFQAYVKAYADMVLNSLGNTSINGLSFNDYYNMYLDILTNRFNEGVISQSKVAGNILAALDKVYQVGSGQADVSTLPEWNTAISSIVDYSGIATPDDNIRQFGGQYYARGGTAAKPTWVLSDKAQTENYLTKKYGTQEENTLAREKFEYEKSLDEYQKRENELKKASDFNKQQTETQQWQNQFLYNQQQDALNRSERLQNQVFSNALSERQQAFAEQQAIADLKARPRNWIQAWYAENPLAGQTVTYDPIGQRAETAWLNRLQAQENLQRTNDWYQQNRPEALGSYARGETWAFDEYGNRIPGQYINPLSDAAQASLAAENEYATAIRNRNEMVDQSGYVTPVKYSNAPPTPDWLPKFVPGLTAGQELQKLPAKIASGQTWNKTVPTQKEMLGGYLEYADVPSKQTLDDYQALVDAFLPKKSWQSKFRTARQV